MSALKKAFHLAANVRKVGFVPHIAMLKEDNTRSGFFESDQFAAVLAKLPVDLKPLAQAHRPLGVLAREGAGRAPGWATGRIVPQGVDDRLRRVGLGHDFRRTAVRNLERAGVPRSVAMRLTGHKTEAVYRRHAIVAEADLREGAAKLALLHESLTAQPKVVPLVAARGRKRTSAQSEEEPEKDDDAKCR